MIDDLYVSQYFYYIISFFFLLALTKNLFFWTFHWHDQQYSLRRVLIFAFQSAEGRYLVFGWEHVLKLFLLIFFIFTIFYENLLFFFPAFVAVVYTLSTLHFFWQFIHKTAKLPPVTFKTATVISLSYMVASTLYFFPLINPYLWLIILEIIVMFIVGVGMIVWSIILDFTRDVLINRAIKKRNEYEQLKVIGIAGSYGKGETKEFLSKILSKNFNTIITKPHQNSPEDIAQVVLSHLNRNKEIFILDVDPYELGEAALISSIVKPSIGILTAINEQHLLHLKSEDRIVQAHFELIESLPRNGIALFNGQNHLLGSLYKKTGVKKCVYSSSSSASFVHPNIYAKRIKTTRTSVLFELYFQEKKIGKFRVNLLGADVIDKVLPGIFLAMHYGISVPDIRKSLMSLKPLRHIMEPFIDVKNTMLIDDTYHSNPASIRRIVQYSNQYRKKKVLVWQPMNDLGKRAYIDHHETAKAISQVFDHVFVTNKNYYRAIKKGASQSDSRCDVRYLTPKLIGEFIQTKLHRGDLTVFAGKEALSTLRLLEKEPVNTASAI